MKDWNRSIKRILILVLMLFCAPASAGIVYFENPPPGNEGHFAWHWQIPDEPQTFENWLNITKPSTDQFEFATADSVGQLSTHDGESNATAGGASVARVAGLLVTRAFTFGEELGHAEFDDTSLHVYDSGLSEFPEGELRYMGVRTKSGNYGWIAITRVEGNYPDHMNLFALAWAYETIPGKPLYAGQIPAPGALAAFTLAAPPFLTPRRRRKESTDERTSGPYSERTR